METASCGNCRFALAVKQTGSIDLAALAADSVVCRRHPPVCHPIQMGNQLGQIPVRPLMKPDDWCGEHVPIKLAIAG